MKRFTACILGFVLVFSACTADVSVFAASDSAAETDTVSDEVDEAGTIESVGADAEPVAEDMDTEDANSVAEGTDAEDAEPVMQDISAEERADEIEEMFLETADIDWQEVVLTLTYDDRCSLEELDEVVEAEERYGEYVISGITTTMVTSYQVSCGSVTETHDTDVLTQSSESDMDVIATGVGSAVVYLLPADYAEQSSAERAKDSESGRYICGLKVTVKVEPASLTLMLLAGQSNMEGACSSLGENTPDASVVCEAGTVYSTYAPTTLSRSKSVTGIRFSTVAEAGNATEFVAGSLTGNSSISGSALEYPLDSLTAEGSGKTGPDSGLAYEWNRLTGEKVWVVNVAWSASSITDWVPGAVYYDRAKAIFDAVWQTYQAEIEAGHFTAGKTFVYWLQGEADKSMSAAEYESCFSQMSAALKEDVNPDAIGIIMVRASTGSYTNSDELSMNGPRIAQYAIGASSDYSNVYVVSNANEQWISNSGVKSYFESEYPSGLLTYPLRESADNTLPTTMSEIHSSIHYSQVAHNENGITAAQGMYTALVAEGMYTDSSVSTYPTGLLWKGADGEALASLTVEYGGEDAIVVPVVTPVSLAKQVSFRLSSDSVVSYDRMTGVISAVGVGTVRLRASGRTGSLNTSLSVTATRSAYDLTYAAGNYTGIFYYNGSYWYLIDGWIQPDYEGVEKNTKGWWYIKNGKVDFTYTGFAQNKNGWWYIENGKVTFTKNSVVKGTVDGTTAWWYVVGSKVQTGYTGLANYKNENGWWYIKNGKVDFTKNTVAKNKNGWWYVVGGKVQTGFTGLANYSNAYGWWYIKNGKVDFTANTVAKNQNGWWYVKNGKVDFTYNGIAGNKNGSWYIKNGKVNFSYSGTVKFGGSTYRILKGKVI